MHKTFYASGFLYHSASQRILLQQLNSENDLELSLFQAKSHNGESPLAVFKKCVEQILETSIPAASIYPVYDYIHDHLGEHFIFYIEVKNSHPATYMPKSKAEWYSLSKLSKFKMSEQTRHDIVVGERVIRSNHELAHPTPRPLHH